MDNYSRKNIKKSQQVFLPIGLVVIALLIFLSGGLLFLNRKSTKEQTADAFIYKFKTPYVGDNTKVIGIVSNLEYPDGLEYSSIEIKSKDLTLLVKMKQSKNVERDKLFRDAVMTFALIDNLKSLKYVNSITNEIIATFNRDEVNQMLKKNYLQIPVSSATQLQM